MLLSNLTASAVLLLHPWLNKAGLGAMAMPAALTSRPSAYVANQGTVMGTSVGNGSIARYAGIPYAQPPLGDLRWRSPQDPKPFSSSAFSADQFGNVCWSNAVGMPNAGKPSEDCLTLNVWTPATSNKTKTALPVMLWIHGGGFEFGSSALPEYNGTSLASRGVVVVTFNYRLNVFGFLAHPDLDAEASQLDHHDAKSGDYGLQDQLAVLRWVKRNIASFGGDPDNVTLFGESAGAHAIGMLLTSPLSQGLFHRTILESGSWWDSPRGPMTTAAEARKQGINFLRNNTVKATSVKALRNVSAQDLVAAVPYNFLTQNPGFTNFAPSVDGYVLPNQPSQVFAQGKQMRIPMLAGFNGDEGALFAGVALPHANVSQFDSSASVLFGKRMDEFRKLYPISSSNVSSLEAASDTLTGDLVIAEMTWNAADAQFNRAGVDDVYVYHFTYTSAYSPHDFHTSEVTFVFGSLDVLPEYIHGSTGAVTQADRNFSDALITYWTNFAKYGNPNGNGSKGQKLPAWPKYRGQAANFMQLGNEIKPATFNLDRFQFIRSFRTDGVLPFTWRKAPNGVNSGPAVIC